MKKLLLFTLMWMFVLSCNKEEQPQPTQKNSDVMDELEKILTDKPEILTLLKYLVGKKLGNLQNAQNLNGSELVQILQDDSLKQTTTQNIANLGGGGLPVIDLSGSESVFAQDENGNDIYIKFITANLGNLNAGQPGTQNFLDPISELVGWFHYKGDNSTFGILSDVSQTASSYQVTGLNVTSGNLASVSVQLFILYKR